MVHYKNNHFIRAAAAATVGLGDSVIQGLKIVFECRDVLCCVQSGVGQQL